MRAPTEGASIVEQDIVVILSNLHQVVLDPCNENMHAKEECEVTQIEHPEDTDLLDMQNTIDTLQDSP